MSLLNTVLRWAWLGQPRRLHRPFQFHRRFQWFSVALLSVTSLLAGSKPPSNKPPSNKPPSNKPKTVHVRPSTPKGGPVVQAHVRSAPSKAIHPAIASAHKPAPRTNRRTPEAKPSHTSPTNSIKKETGSAPATATGEKAAPESQ
jgi:hypothetical protein